MLGQNPHPPWGWLGQGPWGAGTQPSPTQDPEYKGALGPRSRSSLTTPLPCASGVSLHGLSGPSGGAPLLGGLWSPPSPQGSRHWWAAALSSQQGMHSERTAGGPLAGQELPSRIRCLERRCPLSRQALGESDNFPPCAGTVQPRLCAKEG